MKFNVTVIELKMRLKHAMTKLTFKKLLCRPIFMGGKNLEPF